jgi:tetratricopeptide (TPR) repeat protein
MEDRERNYHEEAYQLLDAGNYDASIEVCTEGIQYYTSRLNTPNTLSEEEIEDFEFELHQLYSCRSIANQPSRNLDDAISDATKIIQIDSTNGDPYDDLASDYDWRAHLYFSKNAYSQAIADWDIAISMRPDLDVWYWHRARAKFYANDIEGTIADAMHYREMVGSDAFTIELIEELIQNAQNKAQTKRDSS